MAKKQQITKPSYGNSSNQGNISPPLSRASSLESIPEHMYAGQYLPPKPEKSKLDNIVEDILEKIIDRVVEEIEAEKDGYELI